MTPEHPHAIPRRPAWIEIVSIVLALVAGLAVLAYLFRTDEPLAWSWLLADLGVSLAVLGGAQFVLGRAWKRFGGRS